MSKLLASPVAALGGLLAVLLIALGLYGWGRHDGRALEAGKAAVASAVAQERIRQLTAARDAVTKEIDDDWKPKAAALEARVAALSALDIEPIRLCVPRRSVGPAAVPEPTGQPDGAAVAGGSDMPGGPDLRASILVYAADCERWRGQLTGLQEWIRGQVGVR